MKILAVCMGNTCRSPMFMYMMRDYLAKHGIDGADVDSAGLMLHFKPISEHTAATLKKHGIKYANSFSKYCDKSLMDDSDIVLTMSDEYADELKSRFGDTKKIASLSAFVKGGIPDPYGRGIQAYEEVYALFEKIIPKIVKKYISK